MNTNMTGFQKSLHPCALDESSHSIGRVSISLGLEIKYFSREPNCIFKSNLKVCV